MLLPIGLIAAGAFLFGSFPTGYLLVRFFRREDIRSMGSGNIGATNVLRFGGKGLGAATFLAGIGAYVALRRRRWPIGAAGPKPLLQVRLPDDPEPDEAVGDLEGARLYDGRPLAAALRPRPRT